MSARNGRTRNDVSYGSETFDLSTERSDELVQLPMVTSVAVLKAEHSVQARFGNDENAPVELQDMNAISFDNPIDQLYLSNSAGTGELQLVYGREGVVAEANAPDEVDITDRGTRDLGTVDVEDRTGRNLGKTRLMDSGEVLVDPATEGTLSSILSKVLDSSSLGPHHDRVTTAGTNATINPGAYGSEAVIVADTSGAATLTVEVSNDGTNWSAYTVSIGGSEGHKETVAGYAHVRASVDANLNSLEISGKGV